MFCSANENQMVQYKDTVKKIGSYLFRYCDVLGSGNFSTVYSGVDEKTGRQVAVKVIKTSSLKSKTALKLLQNQVSILKDLDHPNIIRCYDYLTSINNCYIITELCSSDLEQQLKDRTRFEQKQITKWIWDILKGLQYFQNNNIIHRDLKVSNIFLTANGIAKIADFGFAIKTQSKLKFKDLTIGSPIYMSPQGLIYNQYGPKTDVWALGVLIYELLHGDTPLDGCKTQLQLKRKVLQPTVFKIKTSPELKKFVQNCMKVSQAQRPTIKQLMQTPFAKRIRSQAEGSKIFRSYSSGFNSTLNSTSQISSGSQNVNKFQILEQISYDTAVSILHYCRLFHKTCQKVKSQILSQWLLNVSFELLKARITRNNTEKEQYEKLRQVIIEYHNKYQKEHQDFKTQVLITDVLKQCEMMQKFSQIKQFVTVLLRETKLIRQALEVRKFKTFQKSSQSKKYLTYLSTSTNTTK